MFQNIGEEYIGQTAQNAKKEKKTTILSNVFSLQYIPLYIISFMTAMVGIGGQVSPFSISIMAGAMSNIVPILGVMITGLIGNTIAFGLEGALRYLLISLVLIVTTFILKPKYQEQEKNEKMRLAKHIFISTLIVNIAKIGFGNFTIYDILSVISFSIIAVVFYKIFVNAIGVIRKYRRT